MASLSISSSLIFITLAFSLLLSHSFSFQSDELIVDDEESPARPAATTRRRSPGPDMDSKLQFTLEHAFGASEFSIAGTFSARLKSWSHGGQTLTKLRFSRSTLTDAEKEKFKELLKEDDFYKIRLPSNVLSPPGRNYTVSAVKARCLAKESLDEHFIIHMEGVNVLAVSYGSPSACPYPRQLKIPSKWSFNSHALLKYSELAPRTPIFSEEAPGENAEGEGMKPPEKSFWAKYWMYLIPLGIIVMNTMTQAMNMPDEQAAGQSGAQPSTAVRRR